MTLPVETFTITKRWPWLSSVTVEISCDPLASIPIKLGLAVRETFKTGADLTGADLTGVVLRGADLRDKKIERLIASVNRLDGYTFDAFQMAEGDVIISAGCQFRSVDSYRQHIADDYPGTDKAKETGRILDFIEGRMEDLGIGVAKAEIPMPPKRVRKPKAPS